MIRAGIGIFVFACLSACADQRPPIVFDGQTDRSKDGVVNCLKKQSIFEPLTYVDTQAWGVPPDSRSYFMRDDLMVQFTRYSDEIELIKVRASRELTDAEKDALSRCAPYPDFPV